MKHRISAALVIVLFLCVTAGVIPAATSAAGEETRLDLPVRVPDLPARHGHPRNQVTREQIGNVLGPDDGGRGLVIDLQDTTLSGTISTGPYPFEAGDADIDYMRFRRSSRLEKGRGVLRITDLMDPFRNANNWPQGQGWQMTPTIAYRLDLWRGSGDRIDRLGFYHGLVSFSYRDGILRRLNTITEGPFVSGVSSDDPTSLVIAWLTSDPCRGAVALEDTAGRTVAVADPGPATAHEVRVTGLEPDSRYLYHVACVTDRGDTTISNRYELRTAPSRGEGEVVLAFVGDSREGTGGGERACTGSNARVLGWLGQDAHHRGAEFLLFGGDLANGYTTDTEDFAVQLTGWKLAISGFWRTHPIYTGMGNHDSLLHGFDDDSRYGITFDKWPYATASCEAVFAGMFHNPTNGPQPADLRRPSYSENVYTLQYGPVAVIAFNNNYWWTTDDKVPEFGGCPEGYILPEQLAWIEEQLDRAQADTTVRYIVMFAQEPVFPCGGHISDAMWWEGDNNVRAYARPSGTDRVEPIGPGIIEVRNRLWEAVARHDKVAVVLGSHEHEYYRLRMDDQTPVGMYPGDDLDGDGKLDRASPNPRFGHPTWAVTAGTAGAPYYSREETPWQPDVFTSQSGYVLLRAGDEGMSLEFITETGQIYDRVDDLMAIKK